MVSTIQRETEVAVRAANTPGAADRVLSLVVERGVNVRPVGVGRTVARATFQSFKARIASAISRTPRAGTGGGLGGGRASQSA